MKDQYDNPVPDDLVVLDQDPSSLYETERTNIDLLDWYEPNETEPYGFRFKQLVLVSAVALEKCLAGGIDHCTLEDVGIDVLISVNKIDQCLHRWEARGFYHA